MRVFVTGATGWIGIAVVKELLGAGHKVLGLARSDAGAKALSTLGADVLRGTIEELERLKEGAAATDGVIHLAFQTTFDDFEGACKLDREAIAAMGAVLAGSNRPLIITTGTLAVPGDRLSTEDDECDCKSPLAKERGPAEALTKSLAPKGVRSVVMRLAPTNHGDGDKGFMTMMIARARESGVSAYVGDGLNVWPAVHRFDTAHLYRLALEKALAGSTLHAVAEEGVKLKDVAEVIGRQLKVPVESKTAEEARAHFGFLGMVIPINNPVSSQKTRDELGWNPKQCTLLEDLENGEYFKN